MFHIVAVTPDAGRFRLSVNGKGNSRMPYGSVHTLLGAMPAVVHPAPADVAVAITGVAGGLAGALEGIVTPETLLWTSSALPTRYGRSVWVIWTLTT